MSEIAPKIARGQYGDPDDDLDAFVAGVNAALVRQFGPDHQAILGGYGRVVSELRALPAAPLRRVTDGR